MKPEIIETQARRFIEIIDNINQIQRTKREHSIDSVDTLSNTSRDALDALCNRLIKVYEIYKSLCVKNKDKYRQLRNQLPHYREDKHAELGFNTITPEQLWNCHIQEAISEISQTIQETLNGNTKLNERVIDLSSADFKQPIKLLTEDDYSHLNLIKTIGDDVKDMAVPLVGISYIMIDNPPTIERLRSIVLKILPGKKDRHFDFIVSELVERGIFRHSESESYLFINPLDFVKNATRDFLEKYNMNDVITILEEV